MSCSEKFVGVACHRSTSLTNSEHTSFVRNSRIIVCAFEEYLNLCETLWNWKKVSSNQSYEQFHLHDGIENIENDIMCQEIY